jgi:outer membrane beta-barrel protein
MGTIWVKALCAISVLTSTGLTYAAKKPKMNAAGIPESSVDRYRSASHYGPEDAVLNPAFARNGKWEFSGGYVYSPFSSLTHYTGYSANLTIHINRRHAIEPLYFVHNNPSFSNFLKIQIRDKVGAGVQASNTVEMTNQTFAGSYFFSPYYAKMHMTERTVAHFDVFMGLGFGVLRNQTTALDGPLGAELSRPAGVLTAGLRFLLPSRFAIRAELRDFIHNASSFGKVSRQNTLHISLSTSIFFGAFPD